MTTHEQYMHIALNLAHRGLGNTAPNPAVGCIIVKDSIIIGRGFTAPSGRPHAETQALTQAGSHAARATAYVTLEPCAHFGKTAPCAQSLIDARIARIIIATTDPNPKVNGSGIAMLKHAGITVTQGVCEADAQLLNEGFFTTITKNRPLVTLKIALTKDGKMSTPAKNSPWITGEIAQRYAHILRKEYDAILVGEGTVKADNPTLTCRLSGLEDRSPVRVILGESASKKSNIFNHDAPTWVVSKNGDIQQDPKNLPAVLNSLTGKGITRLLVEGGTQVAQSFLKADLVDKIIFIQSTKIMGDKTATNMLSELQTYKEFYSNKQKRLLGDDILHIWAQKIER